MAELLLLPSPIAHEVLQIRQLQKSVLSLHKFLAEIILFSQIRPLEESYFYSQFLFAED
ncbi:MAG TPA: hypothetical protein PKN99_12565 [Cyclobacteriaceae bacterium]|jgi:hypothetical protein|nr:hypothetical protein [Cyclobacteriaceae bacterium]HNP08456.1 hypothetical protein [Cyclobacteriaceae bacterium]HRK55414.1 hypothetical protein [Cyclobacteriaceae bacterium]